MKNHKQATTKRPFRKGKRFVFGSSRSTKLTQYEPSGWEKSRGIFIALSQALQRIRSFSLHKKTLFINVSTRYWQNFMSFTFPFLNLSKKNFTCANSSFGFKIFSFASSASKFCFSICLFSIWAEIISTALPASRAFTKFSVAFSFSLMSFLGHVLK